MNIPQKAIELSIEGGCEISPDWVYDNEALRWRDGSHISSEEIALNPKFWQALGKALGWSSGVPFGIEFCRLTLQEKPIEKFWQEILNV